jgi:hypothetical protein
MIVNIGFNNKQSKNIQMYQNLPIGAIHDQNTTFETHDFRILCCKNVGVYHDFLLFDQ